MANQGYIGDILRAHHAHQGSVVLTTPELHAVCYLMAEFIRRHVGIVQAICRNVPAISGGAVVDDGPDGGEISLVAAAKVKSVHWIQILTKRTDEIRWFPCTTKGS